MGRAKELADLGSVVTVNNGNVGIAKSNPQYSLDMGGSGSAAVGFSGTAVDSVGYRVGQGVVGVTNSGFSIRDTTAGATRLVINSSGTLLVGTTFNFNSVAAFAGTGTVITYFTSGGSGSRFCDFLNGSGSTVGSITQNGANATAYNTSSDYRLKHDIQPMTGALARVAALKPVTYKWNADDSADEGFIAHELAEVCPSAVTGTKDEVETYTDENGVEQTRPKYQGIDTSFLVATLTAAIQEQQAMIESLTARVVALETEPT